MHPTQKQFSVTGVSLKSNIVSLNYSRLAVAGIMLLFPFSAHAAILASFDLNGIINPSYSTLQYQTGNQLVYNADLTDWTKSGFHAVHAIEVSATPLNWAIMIFGDNYITQQTPFAANQAGVTYYASFDIGPTVYTDPSQATQAGDQLRINLLNPSSQIIAHDIVTMDAWNGVQAFQLTYFSYVGDGSGDVRLQILSGDSGNGRFAGAVDNFAFWDSIPDSSVPEPTNWALITAGLCVMVAFIRSKLHKT